MNTKETFEHIDRLIKKASGEKAQKLAILRKTLKEISGAGINFRAEVDGNSVLRFYAANDDKPSKIRVASANGNKREHQFGYERFKISPSVKNYSFVIFAIEHAENLIIYVFRTSEIADVRSLNLRFTDESKYQMTRQSKYDSALNNWNILK